VNPSGRREREREGVVKEGNRLHGQHCIGTSKQQADQKNKQIECGFDTFARVETARLSLPSITDSDQGPGRRRGFRRGEKKAKLGG